MVQKLKLSKKKLRKVCELRENLAWKLNPKKALHVNEEFIREFRKGQGASIKLRKTARKFKLLWKALYQVSEKLDSLHTHAWLIQVKLHSYQIQASDKS